MIWKNSRISYRQLKRILALELFGLASLLLPTQLARAGGGSGLGGLVLGTVLAWCFVGVLMRCIRQMQSGPGGKSRITDYYSYLCGIWGRWLALFFYFCYGLICFAAGAYVVRLLTSLLCTILLEQADQLAVSLLILLLAVYGAAAGLEVRARISELLYWLLLAPLFLLLLLCVRQIQPAEWFPVWNRFRMQEIDATAQSVLFFLPVQLLLFLPPHVAPVLKDGKQVRTVVAKSGLLLFAIQLVLLGIFGQKALAAEEYPLMVLLGMVKIPGDFIKRLDIVMVAIWFFALFTLAEALLYYTAVIADRILSLLCYYISRDMGEPPDEDICLRGISKWKYAATGCAFFLFVQVLFGNASLEEWMELLLYQFALPYIYLLPVLSCLLFSFFDKLRKKEFSYKKMWKKSFVIVLPFLAAVWLSGCRATELENKNFPLAVTLDAKEGGCRSAYLFQNLAAMDSGKLEGTESEPEWGATYYESRQNYEKNHRIQLDTGHTKALVISKDFLENSSQWNGFLETVRTEHTFARNTLVYLAGVPLEKIEKLNQKLDLPLGSYLEQMAENEQAIQEEAAVTLAVLLNEQKNQNRTILIPVLEIKDNRPVIGYYEVLQDFQAMGSVSPKEALYYYLFHGRLKQWDYIGESAQAELRDFHIRTEIGPKVGASKDGGQSEDAVLVRIRIQARLHRISGTVNAAQIGKQLETEMSRAVGNLEKETGIDLSDSFYLLAMKAPGLYEEYFGKSKDYRKNINYEIQVIFA